MGFEILTLGDGPPEGVPGAARARSFGASQARLAAATWGRQARSRRAVCVFDFLGPARVQALLPAPLRAPYLVPLYGLEVWRPLSWTRRRALARAAVRLAISAHTLDRARGFNPDLPPAEIVPLALEERPPAGALDAGLLARAGRGFLLIVGRLAAGERYKGHDELLAALPRLLAAAPGARLVIAGDGDDRPRLAAKAAALGLGDRALFAGFVSEATLAELYRRSAAFVMPSRGEGFGLVYLEAMRAGRPCVAARGGAAEEVVVDGDDRSPRRPRLAGGAGGGARPPPRRPRRPARWPTGWAPPGSGAGAPSSRRPASASASRRCWTG